MIVLIGASGFIGRAVARHLEELSLQYRAVSRRDIDYYDSDSLSRLLIESKAGFLINAAGSAGQPNVDACEANKDECLYANAVLPGRIRFACEQAGVPWGHVSSGCIYAGQRQDGGGFRETDPPNFTFRSNNCSFYSGTKALGEEVLQGSERCYIWRIRIPFNHVDHDKNYLSKLLRYDRLLEATNSLTHLDEFAAACVDCWKLRLPFGTYHLTNGGAVRTSEVVEMVQRTIAPQRDFRYFANEEEFLRTAAKTPRSSCILDNTKALSCGLKLTEVHQAIEMSLRRWTV